ncbi:ABC-type transport system involved in cytochrome bd biosynthesis fused ATPase/permease subunit [Anaerococcus nagyae]|nr:ABC-type transport system involved in cytochrome bd biosynthesis fused ATPase/permease subunit [Anaerococcus nagyae]
MFFVASIVLFLNTFTNVITEITLPVIIVFTILYGRIIFLKIKEKKNKYNKKNI